jgi:hypothetical protein
MIRLWLGIALLAVSWLPGLGYYHPAEFGRRWVDVLVWGALVIAGSALMIGVRPRMPGRQAAIVGVALAVPAILVWPWPYSAAAVLLAAGLALAALPVPRDWVKRVGGAAAAAGAVVVAQALALYVYEGLTARSHELPRPLAELVGAVLQLAGQDSAVWGSTLGLHSMRQVHLMGATWELLLDPPTLALLVGGLAAVLLTAPGGASWLTLARSAGALALVVLAWLPIRAGLLVTLYVHRALLTDYDAPLGLMTQFWSTPLLALLLVGPVLLAWRFVGPGAPPASEESPALRAPRSWRRAAAAGAVVALAAAALTAAVLWHPIGERKAGRVLVEEGHSKWEPTTRAMDTAWYGHESAYNYYCLYDYASRFYDMGRLEKPVDDAVLQDCDVLVIKTPTSMYADDEIEALCRWVARGGGLVLIGEHTNVFDTGRCLNAIGRRFGFTFRYDCCFGIDSFFEERFDPPLVPHPMIQDVPPLDFAVSCSLAPGASGGQTVMRGLALKNVMADYHASNFYPQAEDRPDMRYGAFVQLWATHYGRGRVVAFTDSTQFSNFSMFEPGKPELALGMIEWANHREPPLPAGPLVALAGLTLAGGALWMARGAGALWAVLIAAGMLGHAAAAVAAHKYHRYAMPPPPKVRDYTLVTIDRTVSDAVLSKGGFIGGKEEGFGIFERWILRLGYFTRRASGPDAARGNVVVILNPDQTVPSDYLDALVEYVKGGGKLLVLDSANNVKSTANSLLWPFGLEVKHGAPLGGETAGPPGWPAMKVENACEVTGGLPLARLQAAPVAASARCGDGHVVAVGFSARFCDAGMGVTGDAIPDAAMKDVYEFEYTLMRAIVEGKVPAIAGPAAPAPVPDE